MAAVLYRLRALLRTGWPATAGIAAVVAITGGLALTLAAGAVRTITAPDRYLDSLDNPFEAQVSQQSGAPRGDELEGLPATGSVGVATFVFGGLVGEGDDGPADVLVFAGSATAFGDRLVDGRQAAPDRPGEFVATRSFLDSTGADLGATFRLLTFTAAQGRDQGFDAQPEGPTFDATLVGVLDGPAGLSDDYALALFPSSLLDAGDIGISASIASVVLEPGSGIDDLRAQVADLPDSDQLSVERATPIDDDVRAAVSAQGQGLTVLAAIAAVTTIIVLGQLLSRQYRLADGERVVLSSLGLTRTQLLVEPVVRAAVAAVAGTVAAVALAFLCSGLFPRGFVTLMEPHPGRLFDPIVLIAGAVALIASLLTWVLISLAAGDRDAAPVRSNRLIDRLVPAVPSVGAALGLHFAFTPGPGRSRGPRVSFIGLIFIAGLLFGDAHIRPEPHPRDRRARALWRELRPRHRAGRRGHPGRPPTPAGRPRAGGRGRGRHPLRVPARADGADHALGGRYAATEGPAAARDPERPAARRSRRDRHRPSLGSQARHRCRRHREPGLEGRPTGAAGDRHGATATGRRVRPRR